MLDKRELVRYDRQIMIFGEEGQEKLKKATVAVVGVGGLGSSVSLYLVAGGVGKLILIDYQTVELSNLNRQILYQESDVSNSKKVVSAKERLSRLNSEVEIKIHDVKIDRNNVSKLLEDADIIVDALDNFDTRYLINQFCVENSVPFVHAAVEGFYGQITTIVPRKTPCLRCLFPKFPEKDREKFPVIGVTPGFFGILEANEVLKLITGYGENLIGKLFFYDLSTNEGRLISIKKNPSCPICSKLFIDKDKNGFNSEEVR